jgi:hypothetical protein
MPTLGVRPIRGRWFEAADALPSAPPIAILSHELWLRAYGGDEGVLGRMVRINGQSEQIVGIMPKGYDIHDAKVGIWRPLTVDPATLSNQRSSNFLYIDARRTRPAHAGRPTSTCSSPSGRSAPQGTRRKMCRRGPTG